MKITIVGSGAIGGLFGTQLTEAGEDVTLVDINEELVESGRCERARWCSR